MEENVRLPEEPDTPVTVTFCDDCNPDWDPYNMFVPPAEWLAALNLQPGTQMFRGTFRGPASEALKEGWREEDFGHRCPVCIALLAPESDPDSQEVVKAMMKAQAAEADELLKNTQGD